MIKIEEHTSSKENNKENNKNEKCNNILLKNDYSTHSLSSNYNNIISNEVVKTIEYDDKLLKLSLKEKLIFDELSKYVRTIDNSFRILLPLTFFSYIGYIYSFEK